MPDYVPLNQDPYSGHQLLLLRCRDAGVVMDVGCSAGALAKQLVHGGAIVDGVEQNGEVAAEAATVCRKVMVGDIETLELDFEKSAYDVVLMADVIEHLRDPVKVMARLKAYLRPSGQLLVSTPNVANWSLRFGLLAGRWNYTDRGLLDRTHIRFFTLKTLVAAVREAGYEVNDLDVTCPLPLLRLRPFNRVAHDVALWWKTMLAYQFILAARPL